MEISLTGADMAERYLPVSGGLRLGFTPREDDPRLPERHAGDEIIVLAEARLPKGYKDAGAFDRREFVARQNIHVLATLGATTLLKKPAQHDQP